MSPFIKAGVFRAYGFKIIKPHVVSIILMLLIGSCSQQKFAFRNKIAVPHKKQEIVKTHKEISVCETKPTRLAILIPQHIKNNKKITGKKRSVIAESPDTLLSADKNTTVLLPFHYKQLSQEEAPPKPGRKFEEENGLTNAGLYSLLCGLLTYLFIYWMVLSATLPAFLVTFVLSVVVALGAVILGVMAINQKEGIGFGILGLILGGAWLFLVAIFIAVVAAIA